MKLTLILEKEIGIKTVRATRIIDLSIMMDSKLPSELLWRDVVSMTNTIYKMEIDCQMEPATHEQ